MNGAVGEVRVKTKLDNSGIQREISKTEKEISRLTAAFDRQTASIRKQEADLEKLQKEYDRLTSGEKEPASVKQMTRDLKVAEKELGSLDEKFQRLGDRAGIEMQVEGRVSSGTQAELDDVRERLGEAGAKADTLNAALEKIRLDPRTSAEAEHLANRIGNAEDKLGKTKEKGEKLNETLKETFKKRDGLLAKSLLNVSDNAGRAAKNTKSLNNETKKSPKASTQAASGFEKMAKRLGSLVKAAVVFNVIRRGLRQMTEYLSSCLKTNDQFVKSLSSVKSNLLTAFQPIYEAILPWINALMNALSQVTAQLASFMATIFGTTASQAQKNAQALYEQAKATEEAGDAAEKAERQLYSFDTIQKQSSDNSSSKESSASAPAFETDFSKVAMPDWLSDFWKVFQDSWAQYGEKTIAAAKRTISSLKDVIKSIGKSFMEVWTNGTGLRFLNNIQLLLQGILGIISDIATAFVSAWKNNDTGTKLIQALGNMLNHILELINSIGTAFREAWNSGIGEEILGHILNIVTNIFNTVGNLAARFKEAWEANGNGEAIMSAILGVVNAILGTIDSIVASTAEWARNLNLEPLITGVRNVLEPLSGVIAIIGEALVEIWDEIALPFATWIVEKAIPTILGWLGDFFTFLTNNKEVVIAFTKVIAALLIAFKSVEFVTAAISIFKTLFASLTPIKVIILLLLPLIANIVAAWDDMSGWQQAISVIGAVIAVVAGAAIAIMALQGALNPVGFLGLAAAVAAGVAMVAAAISSATKNAKASTASLSSYAAGSTSSGNLSRSNLSSYDTAYIPHLAEGAVIPPNAPFLAVVGDQKRGTNVETPISTIKQAVREELAETGGTAQTIQASDVILDGVKVGRVLWTINQNENNRRGTNLVVRGATT